MTLTKDQEKEIYVAYKDIFSKEYALLRKLKRVQQRIDSTQNHPAVRTVIRKYGQDKVVKTVRVLLKAKVFQFENVAKMRFSKGEPSPPPTPVSDNSRPKVVEPQAQNSGAVKELFQDPLDSEQKGVTFTNIDKLLGISSDPITTKEPVNIEHEEDAQVLKVRHASSVEADERLSSSSHLYERDSETPKDTTPSTSPIANQGKSTKSASLKGIRLGTTLSFLMKTKANAPISPSSDSSGTPFSSRERKIGWGRFLKLYTHINRPAPQSPFSLQKNEETATPIQADPPFRTQHLILKRMQTILEHACFDFAKDNMPEILEVMQWDCPEAGELNIWVCQFGKKLDELECRAHSKGVKRSLKSVMGSIKQIRHLAVHRQLIHGDDLQLLASHAVVFCTVLEVPDADALGTLQRIRDSVKTQLRTLSELKHEIDTELDNALEEIAIRRAELDALGQKTIQEAHNKFESHRTIAWNKVDRTIGSWSRSDAGPLV
ncbi:ubiquinol-cytochrome-c reductase cytochrome c1 [Fusarium langsethiae]|uniref:Ubiquinol-cytochrome-c reductase cytochrome c1 n=1 Tax=Fusarium langsethiae TaxID=179993 RepID=A0A0M9ETN7_FUSLA|nr:ubiquinol-cytochrome-c reductase cytochrome c1 [Fusarium langsethiae]GKU04805.1 unnamed protein product [Fusarium langsethiae]